ncbi:MAG: 23S rRNA (guanosine(2251)-2'-O)-methyltransferase RlmB [Chloroflexota bacterium]
METEEVIWGRKPVLEAIHGRRPIRRLLVAQGTQEAGSLVEILAAARSAQVPVQRVPREALDRACKTTHHQGVAAYTVAYTYASVDDILALAEQQNEPPLVLVLDSLQDPQNLGSLLRTAEAVGAHGVIVPKHRAAGITGVVVKASAGAIEHLRTAQVTNLPRTLEYLKEKGLWVVGLDMSGKRAYDDEDLRMPIALVVGSEGRGLGHLVREKCDLLIRLPMRGHVDSLNAAVAGSIALYEAWRQRERGRRATQA